MGQSFAATAPKAMSAEQREAEAAKLQIEQLMQPQAAAETKADKRRMQLIEKAQQQMDKLGQKLQAAKRAKGDLGSLLTTIGLILIIIGLVGIVLGVLGIGGGYPAGGGALFLGLVLYLIGKYAL